MKRVKNSLNLQIFLGTLLGIVLGVLIQCRLISPPSAKFILYFCELAGGVFIGLLKMVLIPLVFTSIAVGIGNLRLHSKADRIWKYTLLYFILSPAIAVLSGLTLVNIVKPGKDLEVAMFRDTMQTFQYQNMGLTDFIKEFMGSLFINPVKAMAEGNVMATLVFALILGIALIRSGEGGKTVLKLLNEIFDLVMRIVSGIMHLAPIGIFALICKLVATQEIALFSALAKFIGVVVAGTLIHGIVILPLALYLLTGVSPVTFFNGMREALITALATSSSSATLPVTLRCITQNFKVDKDIAGFIAPVGATANMDGTALYEAVAAIFVANLVGIDLNLFQQFIIFIMAILASIGAPGIPSAGMVTMIMVLQSVGLPVEAIAILLPIDRPLDAIRTTVNVQGDAICSLIVQRAVHGPSAVKPA